MSAPAKPARKCPWCSWTTAYAEYDGESPEAEHSRRSNDSELADHKAKCPAGQLRDQFAMAALTGIASSPHFRGNGRDGAVMAAVAIDAYRAADAMLAAREATS